MQRRRDNRQFFGHDRLKLSGVKGILSAETGVSDQGQGITVGGHTVFIASEQFRSQVLGRANKKAGGCQTGVLGTGNAKIQQFGVASR